jgi:hypothetical protein
MGAISLGFIVAYYRIAFIIKKNPIAKRLTSKYWASYNCNINKGAAMPHSQTNLATIIQLSKRKYNITSFFIR